jgi:hypothetical protein
MHSRQIEVFADEDEMTFLDDAAQITGAFGFAKPGMQWDQQKLLSIGLAAVCGCAFWGLVIAMIW